MRGGEDLRFWMMTMGVQIKRAVDAGIPREEALQKFVSLTHEYLQHSPFDESAMNKIMTVLLAYGPSFALAWAENAFATIEVPHKLGASLMATSVPYEVAKEVPLPWRCFCISTPENLLSNKEYPSSIIVIHSRDGRIKTLELGPECIMFNDNESLGDYAKLEIKKNGDYVAENLSDGKTTDEYFDSHARLALLLGRLVVGVCIEMDTPEAQRAIRSTPSAPRIKRGEPKIWQYRLGRPVRLDVREAVRAYAESKSSRVTSVQVLVCGHRKRQPHGPNSSLRKWIHVEPHWRGPEEAPILVRSHQLGDKP